MLSFKYCGLDPALFARADFLRNNFLWAFLATRIFPVAVIDARFFKYDFVFNFGIFYPLCLLYSPDGNALPFWRTDPYCDIIDSKIKFLLNIRFFGVKVWADDWKKNIFTHIHIGKISRGGRGVAGVFHIHNGGQT